MLQPIPKQPTAGDACTHAYAVERPLAQAQPRDFNRSG